MTQFSLPPCSRRGCGDAGGAVVNGRLFCSRHALIEFDRILLCRASERTFSEAWVSPIQQKIRTLAAGKCTQPKDYRSKAENVLDVDSEDQSSERTELHF
jgi:hypothetical protein